MVLVRAVLKILKLHPRGRILWSEFLSTCESPCLVSKVKNTQAVATCPTHVLQPVSAVAYFKLDVILLLLSEH